MNNIAIIMNDFNEVVAQINKDVTLVLNFVEAHQRDAHITDVRKETPFETEWVSRVWYKIVPHYVDWYGLHIDSEVLDKTSIKDKFIQEWIKEALTDLSLYWGQWARALDDPYHKARYEKVWSIIDYAMKHSEYKELLRRDKQIYYKLLYIYNK